MKIDGRTIQSSGTLVIAAGRRAELTLPFGSFELVFRQSSKMNVSISTSPMQIIFDGTDNPLGVSSEFTIPLTTGSVNLFLAVYAIGEAEKASRVLHYTVTS